MDRKINKLKEEKEQKNDEQRRNSTSKKREREVRALNFKKQKNKKERNEQDIARTYPSRISASVCSKFCFCFFFRVTDRQIHWRCETRIRRLAERT